MLKPLLFAVATFAVTFVGLHLAAQAQTTPYIPAGFDLPKAEAAAAQKKLTFRSPTTGANYDLKYHRLEWEIDPAVNYIKGAITSYFVVQAAATSHIAFDLVDVLTVDSVKYHSAKMTTAHASDVLDITLPTPLAVGTLDSVTVYYQGAPPQTGFGSFVASTHNSTPIIWTLSEPYGGRDWFPCKLDLNDKIDSIDAYVTTPKPYRSAGNGILAGEWDLGTKKRYWWKHRYPITSYLIATAVTKYSVYTDYVPMPNGTQLPILNYIYPEDSATVRAQTPDVIANVQLYNQLFGTYPFAKEKYGHAQFGWGGGEEHQTMSFMVGFSRYLMAHELCHQWFGDKVTCGSWKDIWLNEGFATFGEVVTHEHRDSSGWVAWKRTKINNIISAVGGSIIVDDTTNVNRIFDTRLSYNKGGMVLQQLRTIIGDSAFFAGVRNYLADPALAYGYATTPALRRHLEATSGRMLIEYFDNWVYQQGYPKYTLKLNQTGSNVELVFNQTTSHPSVSFFKLPVTLQLVGTNHDTTITFNNTSNGQIFTASIPFKVNGIVFDPQANIIAKLMSATVGTNRVHRAFEFKMFPNPANNILRIQLPDETIAVQRITLTDVTGKVVVDTTTTSGTLIELPIASLMAGTYAVTLTTNKGTASQMVVKQ